MSAFDAWRAWRFLFDIFGEAGGFILGSWGLTLGLSGSLGRSLLELGDSFWESWGCFVVLSCTGRRFSWILGAIWVPFGVHLRSIWGCIWESI